ncbi:MAG: hypothetical protein RBS96_06315 [Dehalococcoidales bacterium]|jgi:hypothetical protein|nr:hypothetical protein [Dehalococcoidales bacterium]
MDRLYISGGKPNELVKTRTRRLFRFDNNGQAVIDKWMLSSEERANLSVRYKVSETRFEEVKPVEIIKEVKEEIKEEPVKEEIKEEIKPEPVKLAIPSNRRELIAFAKKLIEEGKISKIELNGKTESIIEHIKKEIK